MTQGRLCNKFFVVCLALQTLYMLSFNMVTPLVAHYVVELGGNASEAGVVAGIFSFAALVFRPFVGYASDQVNRKAFMLMGFALCVASMIGYGLSTTMASVAVFRVVHALALSIQTTLITVIAVDVIPSGRIAEGVGYVGIAAMVGMSVGPGVGVAVSDCLGLQAPFYAGALAMLASFPLVILLPSRPVLAQKRTPDHLLVSDFFDLEAMPLAVSAMSFAFCAGLTSSFMVLLGSVRAIGGIATFFFVSSLGMVFVRPAAGRYADLHGIRVICLVGFACECAAMACIALAHTLPLILVASLFRTFGRGMAQSTIQGQVLKDAGDARRGVASSTFYLGVDLGQGLGAVVGGTIARSFGYAAAFMTGPCVLVLGLVAFALWGKRHHARLSCGREGRQ